MSKEGSGCCHTYMLYQLALSYAEETAKLTKEQDLKDFDLAYSYEALARANAALGNKKECAKWLEKAQEAGALISDEEDKKYFISDLESAPWFDCK